MAHIRTLQHARQFVKQHGICMIFRSRQGVPSLWDAVDLPEKQPGEPGWGQKVSAVWTWKNELPTKYPDEIFYGKTKGGLAVLMTLEYLHDVHYPKYHVPLQNCSSLARTLYDVVKTETPTTPELRKAVRERVDITKAQFDRAHKELQVTLNIVRLNEPGIESDTWVRFGQIYPEIEQKRPATS